MNDPQLQIRLGTVVRSLRGARDWSRRELAGRAGLSERFLADVECGKANPSLLSLVGLVRAFGITLTELISSAEGGAGDRVRHVALLGLRGAGKSTVGPQLAARLERPFVELDSRIEAATGLQLSELFQVHGEQYYRQAERAALDQLLAEKEPCVVAVGGGLVAEAATFALLRSRTTTVWLRADPKDHWQRVLKQGDLRPMADRGDHERAYADLRRLLETREPFYRLADLAVGTSGRQIGEIVDELVRRLGEGLAAGNTAS